MALDFIKPDLRFMPGRGGLVGAFDPAQQQQGVPNALRLLAQMQPTPAASFPGQAPQVMPQAAPQQPPQAAQPAARSLGPAMTPNATPAAPQAGGQQYMMSGGLGDFLRSNPTMISNLAAGLMSGSRAGVTNAVANLPNAQQHDRQNAALKQWMGTLPEEQQGLARAFPQVAGQSALQAMFAQPKKTSTMQEYQLAVDQGFNGSLLDYMTTLKKAGASPTNVNIKNTGTIPPGYQLKEAPDGTLSMQPIAGSPAASQLEAEESASEAATANRADKASTILSTVRDIKDIAKDQWGWTVSGTLSRPAALFSGTAAGKIRSHIDALQSGVALDAMLRLKEASATGATGFGALSQKELALLINDIGSLDPNTTDISILMNTIDRVERRFQRVAEAVKTELTPEEIRMYGLEDIAGDGAASAPDSGGGDWTDIGNGVRIRRK